MTETKTYARLWCAMAAVATLFLSACDDGGPDSDGNNDTLFTGLSGIIILGVVIWLIWRAMKKRGGNGL